MLAICCPAGQYIIWTWTTSGDYSRPMRAPSTILIKKRRKGREREAKTWTLRRFQWNIQVFVEQWSVENQQKHWIFYFNDQLELLGFIGKIRIQFLAVKQYWGSSADKSKYAELSICLCRRTFQNTYSAVQSVRLLRTRGREFDPGRCRTFFCFFCFNFIRQLKAVTLWREVRKVTGKM